ncbi:MAG: helix-turn-helix domain-containing protein [Proteobacteria bacterium]|nr:helix-turn-helix domain-containing protein [Pseudomonadota bacterium]MBU1585140.1 helix-turn-helix domain-containing protein [Pseudomonadota bacterium]
MNTVAQKTNIMNKLTFGQRLVQIRKAMGLTQTELGDRIGVSQRIIHHYENKADYPPTLKLIELAQALNMSVDELLGIESSNDEAYQEIKPMLAKKLRRASQLPTNDLKALSTFIDALILKQQVKNTGVQNEA